MKNFVEILENHWVSNFLFMFLGYAIPKSISLLSRAISRARSKHNQVGFIAGLDKRLNIETIAYGDPEFESIRITLANEEFIIPSDREKDHEYISTYVDLESFCEAFGISIEAFWESYDKNRDKMTDLFSHGSHGKHFNGHMFGISSVRNFQRTTDEHELKRLKLRAYNTDYFTMSVLSGVLKDFATPEILENVNINNDLSYFRNSIGVNVLLILPKSNQIVMVKRSKNASFTEDNRLIYPSVVETIAKADYTKEIKVELAVIRGLQEELGLVDSDLDISSMNIFSYFYEKNYFQDNFGVTIHAKNHVTVQYLNNLVAKDGLLEVSEIFALNNNISAIKKYISKNEPNLQYQTQYLLELYSKIGFN